MAQGSSLGSTASSSAFADLSVSQLADILSYRGVSDDSVDKFFQEKICGSALLLLKEADIKELGVPLGDRVKLRSLLNDQSYWDKVKDCTLHDRVN